MEPLEFQTYQELGYKLRTDYRQSGQAELDQMSYLLYAGHGQISRAGEHLAYVWTDPQTLRDAAIGAVAGGLAGKLVGAAAKGALGVPASAAFAQTSFSKKFSLAGKFGGQTIDDVATQLRAGTLRPDDVPIEYVVRDGNVLILNTRSAQALQNAGIPRSQWNGVDKTGDVLAEHRLTKQLQLSGLTNRGTQTTVAR